MLTRMTTGESVTLPEGVPKWCLERITAQLSELYCAQCGIGGAQTSVYSVVRTSSGVHFMLSCDLCGSLAHASMDEIQL